VPQESPNTHQPKFPNNVILSAAKDLSRWAEILRCAQDDSQDTTHGGSLISKCLGGLFLA
jgi:hypothetical protein